MPAVVGAACCVNGDNEGLWNVVASMVEGLPDAGVPPLIGIGSGAVVACSATIPALAGLSLGGTGRSGDMYVSHRSIALSLVIQRSADGRPLRGADA